MLWRRQRTTFSNIIDMQLPIISKAFHTIALLIPLANARRSYNSFLQCGRLFNFHCLIIVIYSRLLIIMVKLQLLLCEQLAH
jgi:hypothetical protein